MSKYYIGFLFFLTSIFHAQEKGLTHTVVKGETIYQISKNYKVSVDQIFQLNPTAEAGIKENDILLITKPVFVHVVKPKETLYSIARDYKVAFADLKALNESSLIEGLKIGQEIKIPSSDTKTETVKTTTSNPIVPKEIVKTEIPVVEKPIVTVVKPIVETIKTHIVEAKETKYGISKQYGMTISELEKLNPEIISGLPIGFQLKVKSTTAIVTDPKVVKNQVGEVVSQSTTLEETTKANNTGFARYEIKPKETLYSLSQTLNTTQDDLIKLNPLLKEGVKEGMILTVPAKSTLTILSNSKFKDLTKSLNTSKRKELVLLFPFNVTKIENDSVNSMQTRLKKDNFLNMTLDFYSGAMMAIDYGKSLGLNLDIKIFDTEESKTSSSVEEIVTKNNLQNANAIIGPFYQQYAEKVAEMVAKNNVPVISPLSNESGKPLANLFQSNPPSDYSKMYLFDYLEAKKGNIIVVNDSKKQTNRDFITANYPNATFVQVSDKGVIDANNFASLYNVNGMNYIILDSEKTSTILSLLRIMNKETKFYEQQLVILETNKTLDFEEISMKSLASLKLLYPSLTRDSSSNELSLFEQDYKNRYKIVPNKFAIRGFDVTFDTMLRLSQDKSFKQSIVEDKTEQLENKFEYFKKQDESYVNQGIYLLEYQEDLTIKPIN